MNVSRAVIRQFATSKVVRSAGEVDKGYLKLKEIQQKFQKSDGKPVFLKGGPMDQVLYRLTVLLCFAGIGGMGKLFYDLSFPKTD